MFAIKHRHTIAVQIMQHCDDVSREARCKALGIILQLSDLMRPSLATISQLWEEGSYHTMHLI